MKGKKAVTFQARVELAAVFVFREKRGVELFYDAGWRPNGSFGGGFS